MAEAKQVFAGQQLARCFAGNLAILTVSKVFTAVRIGHPNTGKQIAFIIVLYSYFNVGTQFA